jgi:hypothetical protein
MKGLLLQQRYNVRQCKDKLPRWCLDQFSTEQPTLHGPANSNTNKLPETLRLFQERFLMQGNQTLFSLVCGAMYVVQSFSTAQWQNTQGIILTLIRALWCDSYQAQRQPWSNKTSAVNDSMQFTAGERVGQNHNQITPIRIEHGRYKSYDNQPKWQFVMCNELFCETSWSPICEWIQGNAGDVPRYLAVMHVCIAGPFHLYKDFDDVAL